MLLSPLWILIDWMRHSNSLWLVYTAVENWTKKRFIAIPLIILVLMNWLWNIAKHSI